MKRFRDSISDWGRSEWLLLGAAAALGVGAALPWMTLPVATLAAFDASMLLPTLLRAVPSAGLLAVVGILLGSRNGFGMRASLWAGLLVSLLFPFLVCTFAIPVSYIAAAFDQQREGIAYHIETHYPDVQAQWKQTIHLDPYEEIHPYSAEGLAKGYMDPLETLLYSRAFSIDSGKFFQASSWDRLVVEGLNYVPGFLGSTGWGWPITAAALVVALFAAYVGRPENLFADWGRMLPWGAAATGAVVIVIVAPSLITRQINIWQSHGQHSRASAAARVLYNWYPPMRGDVAFILQKAQSDARTHQATAAELDFAKGVESWRSDDYDQARVYFEKAFRVAEEDLLVRSYLAATLLKLGVRLFERGQPAAAAEMFEQVHHVFPHHLQATYCLMIAKAVKGDFDGSAKAAQELSQMQRYFRIPGIAAMGQAHVHEAWAAYRAGRFDEAWHSYRKSVDKGIWE